jgi:NAD(P)H-hydrate epimerase
MAAADNFAAGAGVPTLTLMENAGQAVADAVAARFRPCAALVLCGPGNNGGDGFVVARLLKERGFEVRVAAFESYKGDAAAMAERWSGPRLPIAPEALDGVALVIDGLFGAGLSRPLEGAARDVTAALSQTEIPLVAIDIPSGICGDTGKVLGDIAMRASLTVTFFRKKPAHLLLPGRLCCGEILVADIGIPDAALGPIHSDLFENGPELWGADYPWPQVEGHKYARGRCTPPGRRGWRRGARFASGRAWSVSLRRSNPSRSMPPI